MSTGSHSIGGLGAWIGHRVRIHDPDRASLKAAVRAAVVMPSVFGFADGVIGNPQTTTFSAFGSFAILVLADFRGRPRARLAAYLGLAAVGVGLIALGTLVSRSAIAAAATMAVVGFAVLFAGLINRYFATGSFAALLTFILSANVPAAASAIPDRLAGWGLACAAGIAAVFMIWPPRAAAQLRPAAARACEALAELIESDDGSRQERLVDAREAVDALRRQFASTPYRPTGATGATKALAFLVDELDWVRALASGLTRTPFGLCHTENREVLAATAGVLRASATRLRGADASPDIERLDRAREANLEGLLRDVRDLPSDREEAVLIAAIDPSFRTRALSFAAREVGVNALLATGGAAPADAAWGPRRGASAAREVGRLLVEHARFGSIWFRNSVRGAAALAIAVYVAQRASLQHAFWVVLGTMSVLRSNALGTGATIVKAVAGTAVGILVGGGLVAAIGAGHGLLWAALPPAVLVAAYAPRAISFPAGQAGFTIVLLILFNIIAPAGWQVGLVRVEDVTIGFGISFAVGLLFWPRGARAAVRETAADAYGASAAYFVAAARAQRTASLRASAIAAAHRLDDAYRQLVAEASRDPLDVDSIATLVTGANRLRLAADSLADPAGAPMVTAPVPALDSEATALQGWYLALADAIRRLAPAPTPQDGDDATTLEVFRHLDVAVASGDRDLIRAAVGAALADDHVDSLRRAEPHLLRALARVRQADGAVPAA